MASVVSSRATYLGKARLAPPPPGGTFSIRWYEGKKKPDAKKVGDDPTDALQAQMRQEAMMLAGESVPEEQSSPASRVTLAEAVEAFLEERSAQRDARSAARWKWELALFQKIARRTYLDEIKRPEIFKYWTHFKNKGAAPRTIFNRIQSLQTSL
jgi:hypothetical protein